LRIHARILLGDGFCIRSAANSLQIKIDHRFPSYASANCRSPRAAYPAVCGKRVTLPGDVDRKRNLDGTEQPSWMLSAQVGRGGGRKPSARIGSMGGDGPLRRRHSGKGRAVPALSVDPELRCAQPILRGSLAHTVGRGLA
jgi:hypothetical protein